MEQKEKLKTQKEAREQLKEVRKLKESIEGRDRQGGFFCIFADSACYSSIDYSSSSTLFPELKSSLQVNYS
jgi:hypothetical protein